LAASKERSNTFVFDFNTATFLRENLCFSQIIVNFASLYQSFLIYNDRNRVNMTSWKTCFEASKFFKIRQFLGAQPLDPHQGFAFNQDS
jgi:hypothetical protein